MPDVGAAFWPGGGGLLNRSEIAPSNVANGRATADRELKYISPLEAVLQKYAG